MASNIKYPDSSARYFIQGDKLALITNIDTAGGIRTVPRKNFKAISESITDGLLIHFYGDPNKVRNINDEIDLDNSLNKAVVDFVKKCLYMDKAGRVLEPGIVQTAMQMAAMHEKNFKDSVARFGMRKRNKTGGTRAVVPANFR
jgi:hypothetical protein